MRGRNVFYPMGWDDNGLPTERRVQNLFTCAATRAPLRARPGARAGDGGEGEGAAAHRLAPELHRPLSARHARGRGGFKTLWRRIGLSVDWSQEYSTIDARCRHLAQLSFRDLYAKGHVYSLEAPTMWDVDFQTAVAQAEVEDRPTHGAFHRLAFGVEGSEQGFVIATTRPELLPACVGVTAHPSDARYRHLFGKRAVTPLFHVPFPIFRAPWRAARPSCRAGARTTAGSR